MQRALKRSGLPVWYTEGFHPHLYLAFALPLSLGYESQCESMDFKLTEEVSPKQLLTALNAALPEGLEAFGVGEPVMKPEKIAWARYQVRLLLADKAISCRPKFEAFLAQPAILVRKRTKKGEKELDIKPLFTVDRMEESTGELCLELTVSSGGSVNINPALILDAFCSFAELESVGIDVIRKQILTENFEPFV